MLGCPASSETGVAVTTEPLPDRPHGPRRAAVAFIFIPVMLDMLALGMIIPVLPKLVVSFLGGNTAGAARIYGLFGTVWALMQFGAAPILGALSDRFGRRPVGPQSAWLHRWSLLYPCYRQLQRECISESPGCFCNPVPVRMF
jgi:hypothetical protein